MFHEYSYEVALLLKSAENIRMELRHPYVGTEHLLLAMLKYENDVSDIFKKHGVEYEDFLKSLVEVVGHASKVMELNLYTPMLKRVLERSFSMNTNVKETHLLLSMFEEGDGVAIEILLRMGVELDSIYSDIKDKSREKSGKKKKLELFKVGNVLNDTVDLNREVFLRDKEILALEEILLRKEKNNVLLIGKAGVGKTAIVEEFVRKIKKHEVPFELDNRIVVNLEMSNLVAGTKYRGEFEERLQRIIQEAKEEKNIILFIDEIHTMVHAGGAEGAICAGDILKPALARGEISVIGATTFDEYHTYIEKDKALNRRFEKVVVNEPSLEEMKRILHGVVGEFEDHYHIAISKQNEKDILEYASNYLFSKNNPDKSIDLLDSVLSSIKVRRTDLSNKTRISLENLEKKKEEYFWQKKYWQAMEMARQIDNLKEKKDYPLKITKQDIIAMVERKTKCVIRKYPLLLKKLKSSLSSHIWGQEKAIDSLVSTLSEKKEGMVSFLLTGTSGVGKTQTVKLISENLQTELIKIDMGQYSTAESIYKLIGYPLQDKEYVFQRLKERPYATVLFDEVEKAHPKVLNLLLGILDDKMIYDSNQNPISFSHAKVFLTSNVLGKSSIGFGESQKVHYDGWFSKELVGRIDSVISYEKISLETAKKYVLQRLSLSDEELDNIFLSVDLDRYGFRAVNSVLAKYKEKSHLDILSPS